MNIKIKELLKFLVGGGSAVVVDYLVYQLLLHLSMDISIAKITSFICGSIVGFVINKLWTFESKEFSKSEIARYIILYTITAIINSYINKIILMIFNIEMIAFLCATGVSTILNFIGQKFFVFSKERK